MRLIRPYRYPRFGGVLRGKHTAIDRRRHVDDRGLLVIPSWFVLVAVVLSTVGSIDYLAATLRGTTTPNRVSFAIWGLTPLLIFVAQTTEGVGPERFLSLASSLMCLSIMGASFLTRTPAWPLRRLDFACGAIALAALGGWIVTGEGAVAIVLAVGSSVAATVPTVRKAYRAPHTERLSSWVLSSIGGMLTLLTLDSWTFETVTFAAWSAVGCGAMVVLIVWPRPIPSSVDEPAAISATLVSSR